MQAPRSLASVAILLPLCALVGVSCGGSKEPKEKKGRTILATEYDDVRVGRENSKAVAAQMGLFEDEKVVGYVREIGYKLLRGVPRQGFSYEFFIVDQEEPNAFALPGGYIFVARGLLSLANNEDELACVIGHEITHAARRHSAAQQELQKRGNPLSMGWAKAGRIASYGRDMERDADRGGQMLAAAAGYDPMGMSTFLRSLEQSDRLVRGYARLPTFLDTHPGSRERASVNAFRASEIRWTRDPNLGDTRASLLGVVDGMPVGQRPEAGIFQGDRFIHPDMDFHLHFPAGWRTSNSPTAVGAGSPDGDAVIFLSADQPEGDTRALAESWVNELGEQQRVKTVESKAVKLGGIDAWRMNLEVSSRGGSIDALVVFFPYAGATWRIAGVSPSFAADRYQGRFLSTMRSFRPLTDEERASVTQERLRIVEARPGESFPTLTTRTNSAWGPGRTAVQNGLLMNHKFEGGEQIKIAITEPYFSPDPPAALN